MFLTWDRRRKTPPLVSLCPEPSAYPEIPKWGKDAQTHSQVEKLG